MPGPTLNIKKTPAYPIPLFLKSEKETLQGQIVKLTKQGFLAEVNSKTVQTGEKFESHFELPVVHHSLTEAIVVVKIYTHRTGMELTHLIEAHFTSLTATGTDRIGEFLGLLARQK